MCGRFTMTRRDRTELAVLVGIPESELGDYTPRFNIAPTQPYFVLKTKYENREAIPPAIRSRLSNWIFGCDICNEVCPWNGAANSDGAEVVGAELERRIDIRQRARIVADTGVCE